MTGMGLRWRVGKATVEPILQYRWPRSVKGGKGRATELCTAAHLEVGFGVRVLEQQVN